MAFADPIPKSFAKTELTMQVFSLNEDVGVKQKIRQSDPLLWSGRLFAVYTARPQSLV